MKIVKAVSHLDVYIEQPCVSYRECQSIRAHTNLPFVLDENISEFNHLVAVAQDNSADVVNIKISKFGGLTKAKLVCCDLNIFISIIFAGPNFIGKILNNFNIYDAMFNF